jgi:hypothetical protein
MTVTRVQASAIGGGSSLSGTASTLDSAPTPGNILFLMTSTYSSSKPTHVKQVSQTGVLWKRLIINNVTVPSAFYTISIWIGVVTSTSASVTAESVLNASTNEIYQILVEYNGVVPLLDKFTIKGSSISSTSQTITMYEQISKAVELLLACFSAGPYTYSDPTGGF